MNPIKGQKIMVKARYEGVTYSGIYLGYYFAGLEHVLSADSGPLISFTEWYTDATGWQTVI